MEILKQPIQTALKIRKPVTLQATASVQDALKSMKKNGVSNVAIMKDKSFLGFFDMSHMLHICKGMTKEQLKGKDLFNSITLKSVLDKEGVKCFTITPQTLVLEAMKTLVSQGCHIIGIIEKGELVGVVTQHDLTGLLKWDMFCNDKTLLADMRPSLKIQTWKQSQEAIKAFEQLDKTRSAPGLAIVDDKSGKLIDGLFWGDLRGIGTHGGNIALLQKPVNELKAAMHKESPESSKYATAQEAQVTTSKELLGLLISGNSCVHRLFVVDKDGKPLQLISTMDVLRYFLDNKLYEKTPCAKGGIKEKEEQKEFAKGKAQGHSIY